MSTEAAKNSSAVITQTPPQKKAEAQPLTHAEKEALKRYEQTHHLSALPHEDNAQAGEKSTGEKVFNTVTYKGLGWLTNAAISVLATDLLMHGRGKKFFDTSAEKLSNYHPIFKDRGRSIMMTVGLFSGGTSLLIPIKKLEDYKASIVTWLDTKINQFRTPTKDQLAVQATAHKRLEADPKPTWPYVILGRFLGTAAVVAAGFFAKNRDERYAKYIAGKIGEVMTESPSSKIQEIGKSSRFRNMLGLSLIETYTSFIAEEVLYLTTRIYRNIHRDKQPEQPAEAMSQSIVADKVSNHVTLPTSHLQSGSNAPTPTVAEPVIASHTALTPMHVGV